VRLTPIIAFAVVLAGLAASATSAVARGWLRPVEGPVARAFSVGPDRFAAGQHRGVDLGAPPGSRVRAACSGRVSFAGRVPGGGRTVSVRCGALIATYQHLGEVAVARGRAVPAGAEIGRVGRAMPRPHVHLGVRVAATGEYRDPLALFGAGPRGPLAPVPAARRGPPAAAPPAALPRAPAPGPARAPARAPAQAPTRAPAPAARRAPGPLALPSAVPAASPAPAGRDALPWAVWLGLALVALGLPLGGGLVVTRRRERGARARTSSPGLAR